MLDPILAAILQFMGAVALMALVVRYLPHYLGLIFLGKEENIRIHQLRGQNHRFQDFADKQMDDSDVQ